MYVHKTERVIRKKGFRLTFSKHTERSVAQFRYERSAVDPTCYFPRNRFPSILKPGHEELLPVSSRGAHSPWKRTVRDDTGNFENVGSLKDYAFRSLKTIH